MAGPLQSHQLPNGLYVSGKLELAKEQRPPTMAARAVPYTGGDIKKSGELGRMFDISFQGPPSIFVGGGAKPPPPRVPSASSSNPTSGSGSQSGQIRKSSGPLSQLQPTGLITSVPIVSGSRRSGQIDHHHHQSSNSRSSKPKYGSGVTTLHSDPVRVGLKVPKAMIWTLVIVAAIGLLIGAFLTVAVKKPLVMVAIAAAISRVSSRITPMLCLETPLMDNSSRLLEW